MNSLERCWTVIRGGIPDRVPVDFHNFLVTVHYAGMPMSQALQSGEMMAEAQMKFWKDFGQDLLLVENGVVAEAGACGCEVTYTDDGPPRVSGHILAEGLERIERLEAPDPEKTPPMRHVIQAVRILRRELGDRVFIMGRADQGPGALALALRGYERFLLDLAEGENMGLVHQVLDYCVKVQTRYALALKDAGAHGTATGGLGVSLLSPRLYRQIEQPYEKRFIQAASRDNFPVALHICGDATPILDEMLDTGAPILELDYKTDLKQAKAKAQGRAVILGPVNPELLWEAKDPGVVLSAAREAIEILAPGGGFILGPGCALGYDTPPENLLAIVEAVRRFGNYRKDGSLVKSS
jgi:MtaA/CmuA family methyltransferase